MNKFFVTFFIAALLVTLSGCGFTKNLIVHDVIEAPRFHPNLPRQARFREVEWKVIIIKKENAPDSEADVYFSIDAADYEDMALNFQEIVRYLSQLKTGTEFYRGEE